MGIVLCDLQPLHPPNLDLAALQALSAAGRVASFNPKDPESNPPLGPSGIVVNCPIIATVMQPSGLAAAAAAGK
jgi:hypothetical protein